MNKRIEYIDIARGIGILLVVLGHNDFGYISAFVYKVIYSFHMPLFFFLSGYFLNASIPFFDYLKKRFHSLLKPYLFTIFLIYFTSVSFEGMSFRTAIQRIVKSLYGAGHYIDWVQLWFLPHLFVVSLYAFLFFAIFRKWDNRYVRWVALVVTLGVSSLFLQDFYPFTLSVLGKQYELYGLPFSLDLVLLSGFFFILGSEVKQATSEKTFENIYLLIGTGAAVVLMNLFLTPIIDFNTRLYESYLINTIEAIAGILFVLALSRQLEIRTQRVAGLFKYFGQTSLFILLFHVPIQDYWGQKINAVTGNLQLSIWVGFFMGVAGSLLIYELFVKANPIASWWFGRKMEASEIKPTS
ncbi:MAG: acyltransferase family protein [Anaerolineales bacterium]|nr:acyltransferase family protein [Anaerolineales bacterium]